jgi:hypothetical protein
VTACSRSYLQASTDRQNILAFASGPLFVVA